ncbi:MAG: hypothetical protein ABH835_04985 [Patescibacteria group bacterium]
MKFEIKSRYYYYNNRDLSKKQVMEKYLKSKQYYVDLYDRHTVERCRDLIRIYLSPLKNPTLINGKKPTEEVVNHVSKIALCS